MAIKNFTNTSLLKVNVRLRDDTEYLGCDIPENPTPPNGTIQFWFQNALICIPMDLVKDYAFYEDNE